MASTLMPFRAERDVLNVLLQVSGGFICGAAPSAATSAAATPRRTSMPLHTSGRLGTSSLRASSRVKIGSGIIGQAKHSPAPGWRRRGRGHWISLRPGRKGAFPKIGKIISTNDESFCDGVPPRRSRITTEGGCHVLSGGLAVLAVLDKYGDLARQGRAVCRRQAV